MGLLGATTTLRDFALITFDVDPSALAQLLPGRRRALVSAVNFRDVDFAFRSAPFLRASFVQTNYRAYVRRAGERAVWFFGTTLASRLSIIPRTLWGMPWHRVDASLEADWAGTGCTRYRSASDGPWGSARIHLSGTDTPATVLDGFLSPDEAALVLTHPLVGYFAHRRGGVGMYRVWHERLQPTVGHAIEARFDVFESLGLVTPGQAPHSVLLQRESLFLVELPPSRVAGP
jgi:hypothetical protein